MVGKSIGEVGEGGRVGSRSEPGGKAGLMSVSSSQSSTNVVHELESLESCGCCRESSQRSGALMSRLECVPGTGGGSGGGFGSVIIVARITGGVGDDDGVESAGEGNVGQVGGREGVTEVVGCHSSSGKCSSSNAGSSVASMKSQSNCSIRVSVVRPSTSSQYRCAMVLGFVARAPPSSSSFL